MGEDLIVIRTQELEEEGDELQDSGRALKPASASRPGVPSIPEKWPKKSVYLDDVLVLLRYGVIPLLS